MTALDRDQLLLLLDQTKGQRLHALLVLLATPGLRVGEALALRWQDLDLDARRLYVHRTLRRQHRAGVVFGPPKTNRSRRPVVLSEVAIEALRTHRLRRDDDDEPSRESRDLVFTNCRVGPLEPAAPGKILNRALEDARFASHSCSRPAPHRRQPDVVCQGPSQGGSGPAWPQFNSDDAGYLQPCDARSARGCRCRTGRLAPTTEPGAPAAQWGSISTGVMAAAATPATSASRAIACE